MRSGVDGPAAQAPFEIHTARTVEELERLTALWHRVAWQREEAELPYLLARVRTSRDVTAPFAIFVCRAGEPAAALVARLESRAMPAYVGYRALYSPRVRLLHVVDGGVFALDEAALGRLLRELEHMLADGVADVVSVPPLRLDSDLFAAFERLGGPLERERFVASWPRRRLELPESFAAFLGSRSRKVRFGIRYDAKKLEAALGDELEVAVLREPSELDRLARDLDRVAATSYQRGLGAGFADTTEQRALAQVGLENGWVRAYVLYHAGEPIAYWLCSVYRGTMLLRRTGFLPSYARHRVGIYLLTRVIEDACADPSVQVLDFGQGDAAYKRQFSNETWEERTLHVFAPTFRARRINLLRTGIVGAARLARRVLDATAMTDKVRARWRRRATGTSRRRGNG